MRFKNEPLISYFKIFDKEKIIDQYFNETSNKIDFKNIMYEYRDTNKNSIDIIYIIKSNNKINESLFTSILDKHIFEIVYSKISNEISINKKNS